MCTDSFINSKSFATGSVNGIAFVDFFSSQYTGVCNIQINLIKIGNKNFAFLFKKKKKKLFCRFIVLIDWIELKFFVFPTYIFDGISGHSVDHVLTERIRRPQHEVHRMHLVQEGNAAILIPILSDHIECIGCSIYYSTKMVHSTS